MSDNFYAYMQKDNSIIDNSQVDIVSENEMKKIDEINELLKLRGFPIINFSNQNNFNLSFFLDLIRILQEENEKLIALNIELKQKLLRSDDEFLSLKNRLQSQTEEKDKIDNKILSLNNQIKFIESNMKLQSSKLQAENDDLNKIILQVTSKESQYKNEISKLKKEQVCYVDKIKQMQEKFDNFSQAFNNSSKTIKFSNTMLGNKSGSYIPSVNHK